MGTKAHTWYTGISHRPLISIHMAIPAIIFDYKIFRINAIALLACTLCLRHQVCHILHVLDSAMNKHRAHTEKINILQRYYENCYKIHSLLIVMINQRNPAKTFCKCLQTANKCYNLFWVYEQFDHDWSRYKSIFNECQRFK